MCIPSFFIIEECSQLLIVIEERHTVDQRTQNATKWQRGWHAHMTLSLVERLKARRDKHNHEWHIEMKGPCLCVVVLQLLPWNTLTPLEAHSPRDNEGRSRASLFIGGHTIFAECLLLLRRGSRNVFGADSLSAGNCSISPGGFSLGALAGWHLLWEWRHPWNEKQNNKSINRLLRSKTNRLLKKSFCNSKTFRHSNTQLKTKRKNCEN